MLGDVLRREIDRVKKASIDRKSSESLWVILKDIAIREIIEYGDPVGSDTLIPLYYNIISEVKNELPSFYLEKYKCNNQERFRVIIRNIFTSNSNHSNGLANHEGIRVYKEFNKNKKGERTVYQRR